MIARLYMTTLSTLLPVPWHQTSPDLDIASFPGPPGLEYTDSSYMPTDSQVLNFHVPLNLSDALFHGPK